MIQDILANAYTYIHRYTCTYTYMYIHIRKYMRRTGQQPGHT